MAQAVSAPQCASGQRPLRARACFAGAGARPAHPLRSLVADGALARRGAPRSAAAKASAETHSEAQLKALSAQVVKDLEGTSVFMIGMMGSGKSTIGRLLAQRLGYTHLDTDSLVVGATGQSVAQIFEADGEEGFRDVEAAVLNEVASYGRVVVSTGGGVVARPQNWGHLRNGIVVYLQAPVDLLAARVAADGVALRPLLAGAAAGDELAFATAKLQAVHDSRAEMYGQADLTVGQLAQEGLPVCSEQPAATTARVITALADMLSASDTKKRLRSAPEAGSQTLRGSSRGPLSI